MKTASPVPGWMVWSLLSLHLISKAESEQQKPLSWERWHYSSTLPDISAPNACQLPCKGHDFTMWNSSRKLPDYPLEGFSVLLWFLPCSIKETCCWNLSDLELAPLAGAGSKENVRQFKRCDFSRHLSSYLFVRCCTQRWFNGPESNTSCLLPQDSKAWTITRTKNRKPKLWIQLNKLAGLWHCWESPAFIRAGLLLLSTAGI